MRRKIINRKVLGQEYVHEDMNRPGRIAPHIAASRLLWSYKEAPKLWRHSLQTICSRVAMFPPHLTHYFIEIYSKKGDFVMDPWAGVGTAPLQACLDGRIGIGSDVSPEAWVIMSAKLRPLKLHETLAYLAQLEKRLNGMQDERLDKIGARIGIKQYFHEDTLKEVLKTRALLSKDRMSKNRTKRRKAIFVTALMLGILHGDRNESLSLKMDSSKAYSPNHILRMQKKFPEMYLPKYRNVIIGLLIKTSKVLKDRPPAISGFAYNMDAKVFRPRVHARLMITSPPYLDVHAYAYDNRARLWFLGYDYRNIASKLFSSGNLKNYLACVGKTIATLTKSMMRDSTCVIVFGDVRINNRIVRLGELFAGYWVQNYSNLMKLQQIIVDRVRPTRRRYFNLKSSQGIKCERILVLTKGRPVHRRLSIDWNC